MEVLANWSDFSGGHWGALGPEAASKTQWGGVNMMLSRSGGLVPVCASRQLTLDPSDQLGRVWGMFYGWGADGDVYYVQTVSSSTSTSYVYRFEPDPADLPNTIEQVGAVGTPTTDPDWVAVGTTIYLTVYGNKTYAIDSGAGTLALLTGTYGNAPAGRCICLYGERLMVGGVSDNRFGNVPNRIVFSGDDSAGTPDPTDRTAWETANFFDLGADNAFIVGLYPIRDFLIAITDDQQIYVLTGVPGSTLAARRVYGFHKGSGGLTAFLATHGAVDPSQTRIWLFDHSYRGPARFNGATLQRVPPIGAPHADRLGTDLVEGALTMIGGPDEFVMHGIAMPRSAGAGTVGHDLELIRLGGIYMLVQNSNIADRDTNA